MKSRSVSLTGATGFVGWHIAEALRDAGWQVRAIVRPGSARPLPEGVESVPAPLSAQALVPALADSALIVHCAGVIRARDAAAFAAVNIDGTRAVVGAANVTGSRVLLISSLAAAGTGTVARPRTEDDPPAPVNAYGRSKLAGEEVVRVEARVPWTIIRPCAVYGARDRGFLPLFRLAQRGLFVLPIRPSTPFTLIDVRDLAQAVSLAAASDRVSGQTLFVGQPRPETTEEILRTLAATFARVYRPRQVPRAAVRAMAAFGDLAWRLGFQFMFDSGRLAEFDAEGFVCAVSRADELLEFSAPTSMSEGFERTARWYERAGWI